MSAKSWRFFLPLLFLTLASYVSFFYLYLAKPYPIDFTCFYSSMLALASGDNPYNNFIPIYIGEFAKIPANLNPPFFLLLFALFIHLGYKLAFVIWSMVSILLGFISVNLIIKLNPVNAIKHQWLYYGLYFSLFGVFANTVVGQVGSLLLFLLVFGYYLLQKHNFTLAGLFWGAAIALKFFPGLLLIYVLVKRRYILMFSMVFFMVLFSLLPWFFYGKAIYLQYFKMLAQVSWYGDAWNWSLYGYIYRLFMDVQGKVSNPNLVIYIWAALSLIIMFWYIQKLRFLDESISRDKAINLTIILMLLLSPMCWLYYFPILIVPLFTTWLELQYRSSFSIFRVTIWFIAFFILNLPLFVNLRAFDMTNIALKLCLPSFYGILLLGYLVVTMQDKQDKFPVAVKYQDTIIQVSWFLSTFSVIMVLRHLLMSCTA